MAQAFCHVCYGTSLTFENGVLVCDTCGTQTQTFQEEAEYQAGIDDTRGKRRAAGSSTAGQQSQATLLAREEDLAAQQLQTAAMAYVRCLQQLLQAQAECLTTRFGVSSQVTSLLCQVWLTHLPSTGMLEPIPRQPALSAATAVADGHDSDAEEARSEDTDLQEQQQQEQEQRSTALVLPHNMKKLFWKLLHPQTTLQLCFLAVAVLREAVTCYDIITWALDAQLPFLELPDIACRCLSEAEASALPVRCLQPEVSLSPIAFLNRTCMLAAQLGLQLPHIAGEALLLRSVQQLALPQVVLDLSLQMYFMYLTNTPHTQLSPVTKLSHVTPYVWLSVLLLVAIKLLYGLGNAAGGVQLVAKAPGPPGGWQAWAQDVLQHLPGLSNMPLSEQEVLSLGPDAQQQYLQYCRQHMFAGHPTVPTFHDIRRVLVGWYDATPAQRSPLAEALSHSETASPAGESARPGHSSWQHSSGAAGPADAAGAVNAAAASSYSLVMTSTAAASWSYRLEPQLAAVVLVLAAHSRCSPGALLDCVKAVEKQMVSVEAGVKVLQQLQASTAV